MNRVFADTTFWIAGLEDRDELHERALLWKQRLSRSAVVTTQMVLTELLAFFAARSFRREEAVELCDVLYADNYTMIIPQSNELFFDALDLYRARLDKTWSLVDCASFVVMDALEIEDALTHDIHFEQAGFSALLRRNPA